MKQLFYWICSFLLLGVVWGCSDSHDSFSIPPILLNETDSLAIVDLYNSTGKEAAWVNWDLKDHRTWDGITIEQIGDELRVTEVVTSLLTPVKGVFPESIWNLTELKNLFIASDYSLVGRLSPGIGNLKNLKVLQISKTSMNGTIPKEIGKLTKLVHLSLVENAFSGELPDELVQLDNLKYIYLSYNLFTGKVPLALLKKDNVVWLNHNDFTELPWECWYTEGYLVPQIHYNRLSGPVPEEVLNSKAWKLGYDVWISPQQDGYGYQFPE